MIYLILIFIGLPLSLNTRNEKGKLVEAAAQMTSQTYSQ